MARGARLGDRAPLLAGLLLASLVLRPQVVAIGPLLPAIRDSLGISYATAGLLVTIPVLCMAVFAPLGPFLAGRFGALRSVTAALMLIAIGGLVRVAMPDAAGVLALTFAIGAGMGIGNTLMVVAVKQRFAERPVLVTAIYSTGMQVGSTAAAVVAVPIAVAFLGWRSSLLAISLAATACLIGWVLSTRRAPNDRPSASLPRFPLRSGTAWLLVALFGLLGVIYYGLAAWLPAAYADQGFSLATTGWLAAIYNIATVPSSLALGALGDRVSRRSGLLAGGLCMTVATALLILHPAGAAAWMLLAGLANGAMFTLTLSLPLDLSDHPLDVGAMAAMMMFCGYLLTALAPALLGGVRDLTGDFDLVLAVFPVAALAFTAAALPLGRRRLERGLANGAT